jgi:hypothetical protein
VSTTPHVPMAHGVDSTESQSAPVEVDCASLCAVEEQLRTQDRALAAARDIAERIGGGVMFAIQRSELTAIEEAASADTAVVGGCPVILFVHRA